MSQSYPVTAGYKDTETSREAAIMVDKTHKEEIYKTILNCLNAGRFTAEEITDITFPDYHSTNCSYMQYAKRYVAWFLYIKPRITELQHQGKIEDSRLRRNGMKVWQLKREHYQFNELGQGVII